VCVCGFFNINFLLLQITLKLFNDKEHIYASLYNANIILNMTK
jgi:hypothetical protein